MERWVTIEEFPRYEVSSEGRVRNIATDRIMVQTINQSGIPYVGLVHEGVQYQRSVPKLVADIFVDQINEHHDTVVHLDGDRTNITHENIIYRPRWFAVRYMQQFRDPFMSPVTVPIQEHDSGDIWANSWECAIANGLLESDLVLSMINQTVTWPTYQRFYPIEGSHTDTHPIRGM